MNDSHLGDSIFGDEPDGPSGANNPDGERHRLPAERPPKTRRAARRRQEREARRAAEYDDQVAPRILPRKHRWVPLAAALVLVLGCGGLAFKSLGLSVPALSFGSESEDYEGTGTGSVDIKVHRGDTGYDIGSTLVEADVVKSARTFAGVFGTDPDASKIRPGTYTLRKQMSSASALELLLKPSSRNSAGVTIPEGLWASEIFTRLSKATGQPVSAYRKVKPAQIGLPESAKGKLEGYLFPSTYEFADDSTPAEQLGQMVKEFKNQVRPLNVPADQMHRVLTVGSLVQAESPGGKDDAKVARVIENRSKGGGETVGKLQLDSTVHYAIKKRGTVTTSDKDRASDNPYNTYRHQGLPPGPINNPGLDAIKAAAKPAKGDWLYFVTVNPQTGETRFASDKGAHDANVKLFQSWCKKHPGKC